MPSKRAAIDWLKFECDNGRGDEPCHVIDIKKEQKARINNDGPQPKTKFAIETDSPDVYSRMNREKDRVIKRVGNKAVAVDLLARAWETLTDQVLDRILASEEMQSY